MYTVKSNVFFSNQGWNELISNKINDALMNDKEYIKLADEYSKVLKTRDIDKIDIAAGAVQAVAEDIAYIQGWKDAFAMVMASLG